MEFLIPDLHILDYRRALSKCDLIRVSMMVFVECVAWDV